MTDQWKNRLIAGALTIAGFFAGSWKDTVDSKMAQVDQHEAAIAVLSELARQSQETNTAILEELRKAIIARNHK